MIAGHLQEKKGYYYAVLSYKDSAGKRHTKWIPTGYPVKGNKKKAEQFLMEQRAAFEVTDVNEPEEVEEDESFVDYLLRWVEIAKSTIAITTYSAYDGMLKSTILPWFTAHPTTLKTITAKDIQAFYTVQLQRVKPNTVIHYHCVIHRALRYAVKTDLIPVNPADKVDRPKKNSFQPSFYDKDEINQLMKAVQGTPVEVPITLAAFYGLRKSEALGLKWDAVDFERNTITIRHTVTSCNVKGKYVETARDTTKTKSSRRTLPMTEPIRAMLLKAKSEQAVNKKLCGKCWFFEHDGYVCVNDIGRRITPNLLAQSFERILL